MHMMSKTKKASYLNLRRFSKEIRLVATTIQNERLNAPHVNIKKQATRVAFQFPLDNKNYLLKADEKKLTGVVDEGQLEDQGQTLNCSNDAYWFQKVDVGSGNHYALQTLTSNHYFCLKGAEGPVLLSEDKTDILLVEEST